MSLFRIYNNATGHVLGAYPGADKASALDTYARDAGYDSFRAACEVTGDDPDDDAGLTVEEVTGIVAYFDTSDPNDRGWAYRYTVSKPGRLHGETWSGRLDATDWQAACTELAADLRIARWYEWAKDDGADAYRPVVVAPVVA